MKSISPLTGMDSIRYLFNIISDVEHSSRIYNVIDLVFIVIFLGPLVYSLFLLLTIL